MPTKNELPETALGIGCFYCQQRAEVPWSAAGDLERMHVHLVSVGWVLAMRDSDGGGLVADPVCKSCGADLVVAMREETPDITPEAMRAFKRLGLIPDEES